MNENEIVCKILESALVDKFDVKLESMNKEFSELTLSSLKKQDSFTLLILPQAKYGKVDKGVKV